MGVWMWTLAKVGISAAYFGSQGVTMILVEIYWGTYWPLVKPTRESTNLSHTQTVGKCVAVIGNENSASMNCR